MNNSNSKFEIRNPTPKANLPQAEKQIQSLKFQTNQKCLNIGIWILFGSWCLGFGFSDEQGEVIFL